jgi:hypothetical protein
MQLMKNYEILQMCPQVYTYDNGALLRVSSKKFHMMASHISKYKGE